MKLKKTSNQIQQEILQCKKELSEITEKLQKYESPQKFGGIEIGKVYEGYKVVKIDAPHYYSEPNILTYLIQTRGHYPFKYSTFCDKFKIKKLIPLRWVQDKEVPHKGEYVYHIIDVDLLDKWSDEKGVLIKKSQILELEHRVVKAIETDSYESGEMKAQCNWYIEHNQELEHSTLRNDYFWEVRKYYEYLLHQFFKKYSAEIVRKYANTDFYEYFSNVDGWHEIQNLEDVANHRIIIYELYLKCLDDFIEKSQLYGFSTTGEELITEEEYRIKNMKLLEKVWRGGQRIHVLKAESRLFIVLRWCEKVKLLPNNQVQRPKYGGRYFLFELDSNYEVLKPYRVWVTQSYSALLKVQKTSEN